MGMMFRGYQMPDDWSNSIAPTQMSAPSIPTQTIAPKKPGFDEPGGIHESLDRLAAAFMSGGGNQSGGNAILDRLFQQQQLDSQDKRQGMELQRQIALAQYKAQHPEPGTIERNFAFLNGQDPNLGKSYLNAEANPQSLMTDPTTGQLGFYPKGGFQGAAGSGSSSVPTVTDAAGFAALKSGDHFKDPEGNIRVKP